MTKTEFRAALKHLSVTQADFARRIDARPATVSHWANGFAPVPGYAAYIVKLLSAIQQLQEASK